MRLLPMLMAALVVAALYWWIVHPENGGGTTAAPADALNGRVEQEAAAPVRVVAFRSEARPVESSITLRGRTEANRYVEVRAETSGLVVSEPRRAGARVSRGDVLCRLEMGSRKAELAEAEAALASAEADNRAAQQLSKKGYTSDIIAITRRAELEGRRGPSWRRSSSTSRGWRWSRPSTASWKATPPRSARSCAPATPARR